MSKLNNANIYIHLSTYPCLASQNPTLKTDTLKNTSLAFSQPITNIHTNQNLLNSNY